MKRARFGEEQIVRTLKETRDGGKWRSQPRNQRSDAVWLDEQVWRMEVGEHNGCEVSKTRPQVEALVDLNLDKEALKAIVRKNGWSLLLKN